MMDANRKTENFVNVNVALRIRPALSQDSTESSCLQVISKQPPVLFVVDRTQTYHFDNIFTEEVDQETVYDKTVKPLVEYVKQGYSCTVFAYGQTGTGKTYTMGTSSWVKNSESIGLIPRALEDFFTCSDTDVEMDISVSFIEIYNEKVFDLLQSNKPPLTVKGFRVEGLSEEKIYDCYKAKSLLEMGNKNRHCAETKQNANSSRSHAIFTIHCKVRHRNHETTAKLNLVDLAGSESVKKTGNQGSTFQEGININKGLLCIGQVMTALSTNANFVPYRQSIITTILQDSLNRKNLVSLIACINGNPEDCNETVQTLEFAQRVKRMKNKPEVNEVITRYKKDNPTLFQPIRTSSTPFKRPAPLLQTPCPTKRAKVLPLMTINEPSGNSTAVDSPKSLSSISMSLVTSNADVVPQTFSPVIRKYMSAMESTLAEKIETVIRNTLKRPTRSSVAKEKERAEKENTPGFSWNQIQHEVSKLVRTEIAQLTSRGVRATSSPIDEHGLDRIKKVLKYESPVFEATEDSQNIVEQDEASLFKIPELPITKKKPLKTKRTPSVSPIEFEPRRSTRLSLKRAKDVADYSNSICESSFDYSKSNTTESSFDMPHYDKRRSSARLAKKQSDLQNKHHTIRKEMNNNSFDDFDLEATAQIVNRKPKAKSRKPADSQAKSKGKLTVKSTPIGKRLRGEETSADSPATTHTKEVMVVLNSGTVRQLERLHTIGPKTAQQVILFREIKGPLKKISDLSSMPGWHGKKFKLFVEQNFLKQELI